MEASATWTTGEAFDGKSGSGHMIALDGDSAHKSGASPMELVLVALCGCTATDVSSILRKKREPFTALTVSAVSAQATESPRVFTHVKLKYRVTGAVTKKAMEDAVRLSETKYCSVSAMISKTAKIEYTIEYSSQ